MLLRDLERLLERVPPHPAPRVELEQYATPAELAAPLLFEARALGDVEGRRVLDLGCGTGVLAIGCALLGAARVTGVDVDAPALAVAAQAAAALGVEDAVEWVRADVRGYRGDADVVVMNPPFGAQAKGADRPFLDAAMASAPVVYTLHNAGTRGFVEAYAAERGFARTHAWALRFPLRHQYRHQSKRVVEVDVVALRLEKHGGVP